MEVSTRDYEDTLIEKSFFEKSDYFRFVHGNRQHVHDKREKHYTVKYKVGSTPLFVEVPISMLLKFDKSTPWEAAKQMLKEMNPDAKLEAIAGYPYKDQS